MKASKITSQTIYKRSPITYPSTFCFKRRAISLAAKFSSSLCVCDRAFSFDHFVLERSPKRHDGTIRERPETDGGRRSRDVGDKGLR